MQAVIKEKIDRSQRSKNESSERAYAFANLSVYSLKERLMIRAADLVFYLLIKLVGWTTRFEVEGWEHFEAASAGGQVPIHAAWHECIYLGVYFWQKRRIVYMPSRSFDGEYIARFLQRLRMPHAVIDRALGDGLADGDAWIERTIGILENDLDALAVRLQQPAR